MITCDWDVAKYLLFSDNGIPLIYYSHFTSIAIFLGLLIFTFLKLKPWPKSAFRMMAASYIIWLFCDILLWANDKIEHILFFWTITNLVEPLIFLFAYAHFVAFTEKRVFSVREKMSLFLLLVPTLIMAPIGMSVVGFDFTNCDRNVVEGIAAYYNYFLEVVYIILILIHMVRRYIAVRGNRQMIYRLTLAGLSLVLLLVSFLLANFLGTYLDNYDISQFGHIAVPFFGVALAYITVKYETFEPGIMVIDVVTTALVVLVFSLFFIKDQSLQVYVVGITFILSLPLAYTLSTGIRREVGSRKRIEILAEDLKKSNTRLVELDKQKSEFVSYATHQLRAPLTAMKGYTSMLLDGDLGTFPDAARDAIMRIFESSKTLANVVDDYLNVSRIELGTMKYALEPLDLKEMLNSVIAELKPSIAKSPVKFAISFDPENASHFMVNADRDKLKQVLMNLIDNAFKYTPEGSIDVTLSRDEKTDKVTFSIKDTGIGIDPAVMSKLFSKFARANNANSTNIRGTGLGLFVAKDVVLAHKGKIWAESPGEGKGSTFYVELAGV